MKIKKINYRSFSLPVIFFLSLISITVIFQERAFAAEGYAGIKTCQMCHKKSYDTYMKSTHAKAAIPGNPANQQTCESCHGPGLGHVQKGGAKGVDIIIFGKNADLKAKEEGCFKCHEDSKVGAFWNLSKHRSHDVSCSDCHAGHSGSKNNLKMAEPALCYTCHADIRAQSNRQSHHPVKEGLMKCSSCHDQHGGSGPKMVKADTVNELCLACHADKRGPYLWEHPAVAENCMNCHVAHGSNHGKLLTTKQPLLCKACHDATQHPGAIYTQFETFNGTATGSKNRMFARSCLNCHGNIHGTMGPSGRGKTFVR